MDSPEVARRTGALLIGTPKSKDTNRGGHGGPVGNQKGLKHGYYSLVRFIRKRGGALDKRTILGRWCLKPEAS